MYDFPTRRLSRSTYVITEERYKWLHGQKRSFQAQHWRIIMSTTAKNPQGDWRTHELEKPWEGAQVCLFPAPISGTHRPGQVLLPQPVPKEVDFFGSWEFYVDVPLWSQRLWHLLVKCTDIPAEGHGWALWADTMQMWATLFVQLSHRQQRDKAMHHREYRCPGPLCMPCFLERPTPSHTPTGAHSAPTLH